MRYRFLTSIVALSAMALPAAAQGLRPPARAEDLNSALRCAALDGRPNLPESIRAWEGDSLGRWEGKTLVVDTTNFSPKSNFMGSPENLHLTERFTRVAPDEIDYEISFNDPTTWTRPWTAMIRLKRTQEKIYDACHEDNRPLEGILAGARAEEKVAEEAASRSK